MMHEILIAGEILISIILVVMGLHMEREYWRLSSRAKELETLLIAQARGLEALKIKLYKELEKTSSKLYQNTKVAKVMSERAFNLASSANLACVIISKGLQTRPRLPSKENLVANELAKKKVGDIFGGDIDGDLDWLRPVLSDEELKVLDALKEVQTKNNKAH
jgi:hypothetical protein